VGPSRALSTAPLIRWLGVTKKSAIPADVAYHRVREICLGFPAAEEKLSHGAPSFHVRGKMFLTFVDNHHGDRVAAWCKSTLPEQRRLVATDANRYFVPPYVGVGGWVGVRLDGAESDWIELSILVEEAWASVAPPRIARGEVAVAPKPVPAPSPRVTTDPKRARAALEKLKALCDHFAEAECELDGRHARFLVRKKVFAYFLDNHHGDGAIGVCVKSAKSANASLIKRDAKRFYSPAYIGSRGYIGVRLDLGKVDWADVAARLEASYRSAAPKRLGGSAVSRTRVPKASGS
jgi:hypothetical protein